MSDKALRQRLAQVGRREVRGEIVHSLCSVYGDEKTTLTLDSLVQREQGVPLEPELRYLKDLGYIAEAPRDAIDNHRRFYATAKGYAFWCGDAKDETILRHE